MHDIHTLYRIAYEASLQAQLVSLHARLEYTQKYVLNDTLVMDSRITLNQINALQAEVDRLNK